MRHRTCFTGCKLAVRRHHQGSSLGSVRRQEKAIEVVARRQGLREARDGRADAGR